MISVRHDSISMHYDAHLLSLSAGSDEKSGGGGEDDVVDDARREEKKNNRRWPPPARRRRGGGRAEIRYASLSPLGRWEEMRDVLRRANCSPKRLARG